MRLSDMQVFGGSRRLTPEELGRVFAAMGSDEQAQFWLGVSEGVAEWRGPMDEDMQWIAMRNELLKPENAAGLKQLQSICAWILLHAWKTVEPW